MRRVPVSTNQRAPRSSSPDSPGHPGKPDGGGETSVMFFTESSSEIT